MKIPTKGKYKLVDKKPVAVDELLDWADWYEHALRRIRLNKIRDVKVSTIFLGIDFDDGKPGEPLLFETMIFGGRSDGFLYRTSSYEKAVELHHKTVRKVISEIRCRSY